VHKLTDGVAKWKHDRLLPVDDRAPELCLDAFVLNDERIIKCLFDEDGSQLSVRYRTILAILWTLTASM
jgi:hypothetical protein